MKRSKPRNVKGANSSNTKNTALDTAHVDKLAKLEEQVRLLQLENNVLRQTLEKTQQQILDKTRSCTVVSVPQSIITSRSNVGKSSCGCKGDCSSKRCGCVKDNNKCSLSCKCDDATCQNQKMVDDDNDKENVDKNDTQTPKKQTRRARRNDAAEEFKRTRNLFSPEESSSSEAIFDPMKPKHQLSRTPPSTKKDAHEILKKEDDASTFESQSQPHNEKPVSPSTQDITITIKEEEVDWEQHTAQLVPCKKCKRTFMPERIQKHEACCKKI